MNYILHHLSSRFTAEGENARRKNGRIKDKSVRNVPGPIKEEREIRKGKKQREKGGPQGTGRQRETEAGKGTKREKENLYYAELRASCFCPYFLVFLIRQATERKRIYDRIDVPIGTV